MARTAKCRICGKRGNTDEMYKIVTGITTKTNHYYCSEEEWQAEQYRKKKLQEEQDKVYDLCCDIFGYKIHNSKFFDEWLAWKELKSNVIIAQYLQENMEYLRDVCGKEFQNEFSRIRYFSTILKNSLHDYKPKVQKEVKVQDKVQLGVIEEHYETKYKPKARKALLDFEEDYDGE